MTKQEFKELVGKELSQIDSKLISAYNELEGEVPNVVLYATSLMIEDLQKKVKEFYDYTK